MFIYYIPTLFPRNYPESAFAAAICQGCNILGCGIVCIHICICACLCIVLCILCIYVFGKPDD